MTLRQLRRMAEARQRAEWARVGIAVAWVVSRNGMTKEPLTPLQVIPPQFRPPVPPPRVLTEQEKESENRLAWMLLDRAFGRKGKGKAKGKGTTKGKGTKRPTRR